MVPNFNTNGNLLYNNQYYPWVDSNNNNMSINPDRIENTSEGKYSVTQYPVNMINYGNNKFGFSTENDNWAMKNFSNKNSFQWE